MRVQGPPFIWSQGSVLGSVCNGRLESGLASLCLRTLLKAACCLSQSVGGGPEGSGVCGADGYTPCLEEWVQQAEELIK